MPQRYGANSQRQLPVHSALPGPPLHTL